MKTSIPVLRQFSVWVGATDAVVPLPWVPAATEFNDVPAGFLPVAFGPAFFFAPVVFGLCGSGRRRGLKNAPVPISDGKQ